jgi:predicted dehydrogenase
MLITRIAREVFVSNRREFIQQMAGGAVAALGASGRILGANDRIRIGLIGAGARGTEILQAAIRCPNVEAVAAADVYTRRLEKIKKVAPNIQGHRDFRKLLDDKTIDAVLIATPQHQHALNFVPAIQAGKDVYQEKTMAFDPDHARRMRIAFEGSGRVVQVGIQITSGAGLRKIRQLADAGRLGTITAIQANHYRNAAHGGWLRPIPPDCDTEHVDWPAFEGEARHYPFDPQRYMNWRFYWDYAGGNVFENMVHQVGFWYKALDLKIPDAVTMTGGNFLSPKMHPPDTMNVSMLQGNMLFTWLSMFGNGFYGETHDYLFGNKGTVVHNEADEVFYVAQDGKPLSAEQAAETAPTSKSYREVTDQHMQNFFDCMRSRKEPDCPFELGFRSAIACQMAIASYRQQRTVRWDPATEQIV